MEERSVMAAGDVRGVRGLLPGQAVGNGIESRGSLVCRKRRGDKIAVFDVDAGG